MNKNIRLSIILPCYNVENYILDCLESIYNQDISETEYEVICVNDCSPDNSREIIIQYQKEHSNLILIDHEVNKKQGGARNTGLKVSKGKYIWFVDPDDYISKNVFSKLLIEAEENQLDVLNFEFNLLAHDKTVVKDKLVDIKEEITNGKYFINKIIDFWWKNGSPCRRIYKSTYLQKIQLKFRETGYLEDQFFSLKSVYFADRFKHIAYFPYNYRYNSDSSLNTKFSSEKYLSILFFSTDLLAFSNEIHYENNVLATSIDEVAMYNLNNVLKPSIYFNQNDRKKAYTMLMPYIDKIISLQHFKGWKLYLIKNINFSRFILFFISPFLQLIRNNPFKLKVPKEL